MESLEENNLFFTCSLIEYIARSTSNEKKVIVEKLGRNRIKKIYNLAEVYHCENIEKVCNDFVEECNIANGNYTLKLQDNKPTFWDVGKVYKRLIIMLDKNPDSFVDNLIEVFSSWIIKKIDNYESSMYYENPSYIYECYKAEKVL